MLQVFTSGFGSSGEANNTPEPETHHRTPLPTTAETEPKVAADTDRKSRDFPGDDDVRQSPRESILLSRQFAQQIKLFPCADILLSVAIPTVAVCFTFKNTLNFGPDNFSTYTHRPQGGWHSSISPQRNCWCRWFLPRDAPCIVQSAVLRSHVLRPSVCLSVCLSVTLVICDHIGRKSWKLIARIISPAPSLFVAKRRST